MIKIKDWSKYQSYKDRRPPWIRFHRTMIDNYEYQSMSAEARALLPMLWLLACEDEDPKSGLIKSENKIIAFRLRQDLKIISKSLKELQDVDFIECIESVTKPLQDSNDTVQPETETETETETDFQRVWCLYQKKGNKKTSRERYIKLSPKDKSLINHHLPEYVKSTPVLKYRKNFEVYINKECWNDEITENANEKTSINNRHNETPTDRSRVAADKLRRQQESYAENSTLIQINDRPIR